MKKLLSVAACLLCLALAAPAAQAGHHKKPKKDKIGILLVTFGTSVPRAAKVFPKIEAAYKKAFPRVPLFWAYTSRIIRAKLAKQGRVLPSPAQALADMAEAGFTKVAVQSLHVIPGAEFHDLLGVVHGFKAMGGPLRRLIVARPLCSTTDDLRRVAAILLANLPAKRKAKDAVIFMGHGTHHPAGVVYPAMAYLLGAGHSRVFMGTVEGYPTLQSLLPILKAYKIKRAWLMPFMTVAGDHAQNDMAGSEPDSWKSILAKKGIKPIPVIKAISEIPAMVQVWIDHTKVALKHFRK